MIRWEGLDWIEVAHHKDKWRTVVITVTKVQLHERAEFLG